MTRDESSRREFCAGACRGLAAATLGAAVASLLEGCNTFTYPTPVTALQTLHGPEANGSIQVTVDGSPLAASGGAALVSSSAGPLLVVRTGDTTFSALNGTCTHRTCTITGYINQNFVCPCHGSRFDTTGAVVMGPAQVALGEHATQFANGVLTIQL
jgi:Rieske Fe-S protein